MKEFYTPKEIQEKLHKPKSSIYAMIKSGVIPSIKLAGCKTLFIPKDLFDIMLEG